MNGAATQDGRAVLVFPTVDAVLKGGAAPTPRAAQMLQLLEAWAAKGASRLDLNLDGKIDDPGAAIMDAVVEPLGRRRDDPGARPGARRAARGSPRPQRRREPRRLVVHRRLVRLRRQGPALAARAAGEGRVLDALLRQRRPRRVPRLAVGRTRRGRHRARRRPGRRPGRVARGRDRGADQVHLGDPLDDDALDEPADLPAGRLVRPVTGSGSCFGGVDPQAPARLGASDRRSGI